MISNKKRSYGWLIKLAGVLVLIGVVALARGPIADIVWRVLSPVFAARFVSAEQAISTQALLADRDALYKENLDLKARLGRPGSEPGRTLAAVLLRPPATPYDTLVINAGSAEGVAQGAQVSAGGTTLVGNISQVFAHSARVTLYSAPGQQYATTLNLRSGKIPVTVAGQGGGSMTAQVPAGTAVAVGDTVALPSAAGGLVARVVGLSQGESESFVSIYLTLPVNPSELQYVEVWRVK